MRTVRITGSSSGLALRPVNPFHALPASRLSPQASMLARVSAVTLAAALVSTFVVTGSSLEPSPALAAALQQGEAGASGSKDQTRAPSMLVSVSFDFGRFERHAPLLASDLAARLKPVVEAKADWRETEFAAVAVLDGRTLDAGGLKIRLGGVELPGNDAICKTVDGRLERCATRAVTTLELQTRWRRVTCRYQMQGLDQAVGSCRVGGSDLADRLVRAGYARREASAALAVAAK